MEKFESVDRRSKRERLKASKGNGPSSRSSFYSNDVSAKPVSVFDLANRKAATMDSLPPPNQFGNSNSNSFSQNHNRISSDVINQEVVADGTVRPGIEKYTGFIAQSSDVIYPKKYSKEQTWAVVKLTDPTDHSKFRKVNGVFPYILPCVFYSVDLMQKYNGKLRTWEWGIVALETHLPNHPSKVKQFVKQFLKPQEESDVASSLPLRNDEDSDSDADAPPPASLPWEKQVERLFNPKKYESYASMTSADWVQLLAKQEPWGPQVLSCLCASSKNDNQMFTALSFAYHGAMLFRKPFWNSLPMDLRLKWNENVSRSPEDAFRHCFRSVLLTYAEYKHFVEKNSGALQHQLIDERSEAEDFPEIDKEGFLALVKMRDWETSGHLSPTLKQAMLDAIDVYSEVRKKLTEHEDCAVPITQFTPEMQKRIRDLLSGQLTEQGKSLCQTIRIANPLSLHTEDMGEGRKIEYVLEKEWYDQKKQFGKVFENTIKRSQDASYPRLLPEALDLLQKHQEPHQKNGEEDQNLKLLTMILENPIICITGCAGTGKTEMLRLVQTWFLSVYFGAFENGAVDELYDRIPGAHVETLHTKLLSTMKMELFRKKEFIKAWQEKKKKKGAKRNRIESSVKDKENSSLHESGPSSEEWTDWKRRDFEKFAFDVVVVDEAGTLREMLAHKTLEGLKARRYIFCGDPNQTEPFGPRRGRFFEELLSRYPTLRLTKVHRQKLVDEQGRESLILSNALQCLSWPYVSDSTSELFKFDTHSFSCWPIDKGMENLIQKHLPNRFADILFLTATNEQKDDLNRIIIEKMRREDAFSAGQDQGQIGQLIRERMRRSAGCEKHLHKGGPFEMLRIFRIGERIIVNEKIKRSFQQTKPKFGSNSDERDDGQNELERRVNGRYYEASGQLDLASRLLVQKGSQAIIRDIICGATLASGKSRDTQAHLNASGQVDSIRRTTSQSFAYKTNASISSASQNAAKRYGPNNASSVPSRPNNPYSPENSSPEARERWNAEDRLFDDYYLLIEPLSKGGIPYPANSTHSRALPRVIKITDAFSHAYAMTTNKSQGRQKKYVVLLTGSLETAGSRILSFFGRKHLYTAITRATDQFIYLGARSDLLRLQGNAIASCRCLLHSFIPDSPSPDFRIVQRILDQFESKREEENMRQRKLDEYIPLNSSASQVSDPPSESPEEKEDETPSPPKSTVEPADEMREEEPFEGSVDLGLEEEYDLPIESYEEEVDSSVEFQSKKRKKTSRIIASSDEEED